MNSFVRLSALAFILTACSTSQKAPLPPAPAAAAATPPASAKASLEFNRSYLDPSTSACTDFYQYSSGGWLAANPIPSEFSSWGTLSHLSQSNRETLRDVMTAAAAKDPSARTPNEQKIGDFWTSCMAEGLIDSARLQPIQPELNRIAAISSPADLQVELARLQSTRIHVPFNLHSTQDLKDSSVVTAEISQGGLSLPDRDYYTKTDEASQKIRDQFREYLVRMFTLAGDDAQTSAANAATVIRMESGMAAASMTRVQRRDPASQYHLMTLAALGALTPHLDWAGYFRSAALPPVASLNVSQPEFLKEVDRQIASNSLADWKTYLRWHLIDETASSLSNDLATESFRFHGTVLQGQKEQLPRWQRCVIAADDEIGEALGQAYVDRKFSPEAKAHVTGIVDNMIAALRSDLSTLAWMSQPTREQALRKLASFRKKIAYPDSWRDYSAMAISNGPYVNNILAAESFEFRRDLAKVGKPVDREEWGMTPPTINAYYDGSLNEIVFPAGILQWPMFDVGQDDAFNYGAVGSVIGHEMTHGFDDKGSQFDANGNLANWWTDADLKSFQARAECIVQQFDSYEIEPGIHHNGKLVAGESIADLGGTVIAWEAWKHSLEGKPPQPSIDGFTPEQRFFLGFARARARNTTPEAARLRINTDPHPAAKFRVNGPLSNMPQFATAFGCKAGDAMVRPPEKRCVIW